MKGFRLIRILLTGFALLSVVYHELIPLIEWDYVWKLALIGLMFYLYYKLFEYHRK